MVPDASAVAPIVERSEAVTAGGQQVSATMTGSTAGWLTTTGHSIARGRIFTSTEVTSGAHVTVLGSSIAQRLFPGSGATGQSVTIAGSPFSVIGVLAAPTAGGGDSVALVPVTSAQGITGSGIHSRGRFARAAATARTLTGTGRLAVPPAPAAPSRAPPLPCPNGETKNRIARRRLARRSARRRGSAGDSRLRRLA